MHSLNRCASAGLLCEGELRMVFLLFAAVEGELHFV